MIAALALLVCQAIPQGGLQEQIDWDSKFHEEKISKWRPAASYAVPEGELQSDASLLPGAWKKDHRMDKTILNFTAGVKGKFTVEFYTTGCLSTWKASRTATFSNGVIRLSRAVEPYSGETFDRLYLLKRDGRLTLVPFGTIERAKVLGAKKPADIDNWVAFFQYTK